MEHIVGGWRSEYVRWKKGEYCFLSYRYFIYSMAAFRLIGPIS